MMEIVQMKQAHVAAVARLEKLCFSDPWSENSIAYELTNPLSLWLVAVQNGSVLGYVGSQTVMGESDMMNLAVMPEYRGQGIATELVCRLISQLSAKGNYCLFLFDIHSKKSFLHNFLSFSA